MRDGLIECVRWSRAASGKAKDGNEDDEFHGLFFGHGDGYNSVLRNGDGVFDG